MRFLRPALPALLLFVTSASAAVSQSVVAPAPGSLPPPRPLSSSPTTSPPPATQGASTQPRPSAAPSQPRPQTRQTLAQAPRPTQGQPRNAQPPTVGRTQPPPNRRPAAAAAGAAAAGAATTAATTRTPEPPQPAPAAPPQPAVGSVTGLALPRFAALRSDEVNMRVGPSTTYPIEWTFQRRDLPVQIIGEFQLWRRIRDVDGAEGWVHSSTLSGRRTVLVRPVPGATEVTLRRDPDEGASAVARLRPGVIARIRECEANSPWCEVQIAGYRGYLRRSEVWGVGRDEEVK